MPRLAIIGAGGHGRVVLDAAEQIGAWEDIVVFDDVATKDGTQKVKGAIKDLVSCSAVEPSRWRFVVAVGHNLSRLKLAADLETVGLRPATLIHPRASVSAEATIGDGSVVLAMAVVAVGARVGPHCIVNHGAIVDHDCRLGAGVHLSPGARLGGTVVVGEGSWLGLGSSVRNNIRIAAGTIIGAGAAVVSDIDELGVYVGVPARKLSS